MNNDGCIKYAIWSFSFHKSLLLNRNSYFALIYVQSITAKNVKIFSYKPFPFVI